MPPHTVAGPGGSGGDGSSRRRRAWDLRCALGLDDLIDNIVSGTVIVFDELYNYPGAEEQEFRAFRELMDHTGKKPIYLADNQYFEQKRLSRLRDPIGG
ncbi:hypothetical protein [Mycobacterium sp. MUNTM1]